MAKTKLSTPEKLKLLNENQVNYLKSEMENEIRCNNRSLNNLANAYNELMKQGITTDKDQFNHVLRLANFFIKDIRNTKRWFLHHLDNPHNI